MITKSEAILDAIRKTDVGSDIIIIHNSDMSIWFILTIRCKEHPEMDDDNFGIMLKIPPPER